MVSRNSSVAKIPHLDDDTKPNSKKSLVNEYIQNTTLHGVSHIAKGSSKSLRYYYSREFLCDIKKTQIKKNNNSSTQEYINIQDWF